MTIVERVKESIDEYIDCLEDYKQSIENSLQNSKTIHCNLSQLMYEGMLNATNKILDLTKQYLIPE